MASPARSHTARRAERSLIAVLAVLALALGACGGSGDESDGEGPAGDVVDISGTEPVGEILGGSVAALVECRDWNAATDEEKQATIEDVRASENPGDPGIDAPALTDTEARELFDNACEPAHAQGFRLYKIYAHAAGFIGLERAIEEGE